MLEKKDEGKIIRRILKRCDPSINEEIRLLLKGEYQTKYNRFDKFTIVELEIMSRGYVRHFFGMAVKNPADKNNPLKGSVLALKEALFGMLDTLSVRDTYEEYKQQEKSECDLQELLLNRSSKCILELQGLSDGTQFNMIKDGIDLINLLSERQIGTFIQKKRS